jgi:hypothetical protein
LKEYSKFIHTQVGGPSTMGKTMHLKSKMPASQLLMCCCIILKTKGHLTFLPPQVVGQQLASKILTKLGQLTTIGTWELLEHEDWELNKLQALLLWRWSKENHASFRIIISF